MRTMHKAVALSLLGVCGLIGTSVFGPSDASATPVPVAKQVVPPESTALPAGVALDAGSPTTATIVFATTPAVPAVVTWGRKTLGRILPGTPLVVVRPRDSGPLDVMVRATGYLPVQTRAHTFSDTRVLVKLTPPENVSELLGYRLPLDAGLEGGLEGPDGALAWDAGLATDGGALPLPAADAAVPFQTIPAQPSPWLIQ